MFTGRYEPIPGSGQLNQPTTGESMAATFKADYMTPFLLMPGMEQTKREELFDRVSALRIEGEKATGMGQRGADWIAGMTGSILNPLSLLSGEAAGVAFKAASPMIARGAGLVGRYLPSQGTALLSRPMSEVLSSQLPEFIGKETTGTLAQKAVSGYAQATAFALPAEVANTYDPKTDTFNWQQGIKASAADGGFGLALMASPYLAGTLWGKFFRASGAVADHTKMPLPGESAPDFTEAHIDKAVADKWMTPQEGQWFKDYIFKGDTHENLSKRATEMLVKDGHPVDSATNQVMFKILHPDDVNNFQTSVADKLAAHDLPENIKHLFSEYIGKNRIDGLRENPNVIDGLRGVVSFVRKRLDQVPEEMVNFHKIMRRLLPESLKEENPFTQSKLYRAAKKGGRGMTIPSQVQKRLKQEEKINRIKQQNRDYAREHERTGKPRYQKLIARNEERINELTGKLEPLLSHADEMKHLRSVLLPDGNVAENFKSKPEYSRLLDLTRVRNDARRLMHEVNLKHEYELHDAYATMLDAITKTMRSEFGKLAKPENINDYMRERIQRRVPEFKNLELQDVKESVKVEKEKINAARAETKTPEGRDKAVEAMDSEIRESASKENKEEYAEIKTQMDEFKDNEAVFSNLVKCVMGAMNV